MKSVVHFNICLKGNIEDIPMDKMCFQRFAHQHMG
jgi:hypothetical protein